MENTRKIAKVAVLQVNLLSMNFAENLKLLSKALELAKKENASVLVCPELCICGYGCEDHFFENDTVMHSWEVLASLINAAPDNLLYVLGMPVVYDNSLYNCLICCLNKKILLIRPKTVLKNNGNCSESRWFAPWNGKVCDYHLPTFIQKITEQEICKFGAGVIKTTDGILLEPQTESEIYANGPFTKADILLLASSSHYELSLYEKRAEYLKVLSRQRRAVVLCSNYLGLNGGRVYYDGGSLILRNGEIISQAPRFSLKELDIAWANVCIDDLRNVRITDKIWSCYANNIEEIIEAKLILSEFLAKSMSVTPPITLKILPLHEELGFSSTGWVWDYLRRSKAIGYFIPLSGGADSASCAAIVGLLSERLFDEYKHGNTLIIEELKRIADNAAFAPSNHKEIAEKLLNTAYLGTTNSSKETRDRAKKLAEEIGVNHIDASIDDTIDGLKKTAEKMTNFVPKFEAMGGSRAEDIALQNIQARSRLILSYYVAQMLPVITKRKGFFFVMATGNGDECIRGYFTKYDNSSGDLDPIGGWSKGMVNEFLEGWAHKYPTLGEIRNAKPSAELKPMAEGKQVQTDEQDMGFTYAELGLLGKLRKVDNCGPVNMFEKLLELWKERDIEEIANKVKKFFIYYAINRHKMTSAPAGLYTSSASCDDNRYDQRQFVYDVMWKYQFECIDKMVAEYKKH